ncbi:MAG: helix-turn-helix transcriptional regulator [Phycisphaeraceae bacterium]|nr:helix-turn-helix transcriptional regulator [Phycisphaeraceae bacterium]
MQPREDIEGRPPASPGGKHVARLFARRWTVPVLAQLHREGGSRFVSLAYRLSASEGAVRAALDDLIEGGLIMPNPGYGHPLRPEYVLTPRGVRAGVCCARLEGALESLGLRSLVLRKWTMPVMWAVGEGPARFTAVSRALSGATDRVVAGSLRELCDARLLARRVHDDFPPTSLYVPTREGRSIAPILAEM